MAGQRGIPRHVRALITDHLNSVAQLEILLLLHDHPDQTFPPADVAERLRIEPAWAADELNGLQRSGLVGHDSATDAFQFAPRTPELKDAVDGLAKAFSTHRVSVITLLFSTPSEGIGSFADAFKLRKDDDRG